MVADLIPNHQRAQAYALLRMAINLGVVTGPLIGGWIIAEHSFDRFLDSRFPVTTPRWTGPLAAAGNPTRGQERHSSAPTECLEGPPLHHHLTLLLSL